MKMSILNTGRIMLGMALVLLATTNIHAQRGYGMHSDRCFRADSGMHAYPILNLTDDQEKKITELRTTHQKEMVNYRNDLAIKRAELQKYRSAEKPDMSLVNKTIDEIGRLTTDMYKKQVSHELTVRSLLTEEQRAVFDARHGFMDFGEGRGMHGFEDQNGGPGMNHGGRNHRM
jgi:Spy/CpxP family protein refolding chaperone